MWKTSRVLATFVLAAALVAPQAGAAEHNVARAASGWELADEIRERVQPPLFPDREVVVTDFGADPTGAAMSTEAFRTAIEQVSGAGGGRVTVPAGTFLTGAIHLQSNVDLHVSADAVVRFSQDPADYLPVVYTRWEGVELFNYSPFVYAYRVENVAITGSGTLDGQADDDHWWNWQGSVQAPARSELFRMGEEGVPVEERVFGAGHFLRPNFVQFYESTNILVQGVTLTNSPMWMIHPVLSENVTVDDIVLDSPNGPNNDGVNPESSRDVVIKNSQFDNGDDCIAIKSGRNAEGRRIGVPSENIVIENNHMQDGHGGVVMGSEMSGSVRNVFAENNVMDSPDLDRALRIKTNSVRGGVVENVYFRQNEVREVGGEVIRVNLFYEEGDAGEFTPIVRNIYIDDVHSNGGSLALYLRGYERSPVSNINITNSTFDSVANPTLLQNVQGLRMTNVTINGESSDTGHVCDGRVWSGYVFTGVTDRAVDDGGCLSELIADDGTFASRGHYVGYVTQVTSRLRAQGAITGDERTELIQAAGQELNAGTPVELDLGAVDDIDVGQTVEMTASFTNQAGEHGAPVRDVRLGLLVPEGWRVEPTTRDAFGAVVPGETVQTTWAVTRTPGRFGVFRLRAEAGYVDPQTGQPAQTVSDDVVISDPVTIEPSDVQVVQPAKLADVRVAEVGVQHYVDRTNVITELPGPLAGGVLVPGANDDKRLTTPEDYLVFDVARDSTVYVAFDGRGSPERSDWWPEWLAEQGFERTDMTIRTNDSSQGGMVVFGKEVPAGRVTLGPNAAPTNSSTTYVTLVLAYGR